MAASLLDDAFACIHQNDGQAGGGSAGDHVACILDVTGGVGDDELAFWGGKEAVGHIDGDALFAFRAQTIGQQGQVHDFISPFLAGFLHRFQLVFKNGFAVVEQSADQCAFAVVHASGCGEAQEVHVQITFFSSHVCFEMYRFKLCCGRPRNIRLFCGLPWRFPIVCHRRGLHVR